MEPDEPSHGPDAGHADPTGSTGATGSNGGGAQENLFSRRVRAGKRTYFFDVKATKSVKDFYIVITESRRVSETQYEKHKIFLYKEDFAKFLEAIGETTAFVERELLEKTATPG